MPIYEYRCNDCGKNFEELILSSGDPPAPTCRHCAGGNVTRQMSVFAAHTHAPAPEPGPCGGCGAAQRGLCGVE